MSNPMDKFFSIPTYSQHKAAVYVAVWPCGSRWTIESARRGEWSAPIYRDGQQTNVSIEADTRRELLEQLRMEGATIEYHR